ncbi:glycosyltransferase family 39 protein [Pseudomonas sp. fls2-241-R2A-110]|uniref:glycosyltransferase family 39 protein n=1 Tax=Pseudomonas sp. fls2-241-R2A-110 TaxID=3040311 RepID=UPI00255522A6|nr:glycosyltransferase family 39 protein [Pseudomonas sp. fls2-241-R2A-110]
MKVSPRFADRAALISVVVIALIVRFHAISVPAVWYDEAYSLFLAEGSPSYIWSTTALDVHPPLYYVLLHYWMLVFGNGVLSARSLSALADLGTLLLCIKLMSLVATRRATWIAALLLALLPISVRYSQEIRMYTLLGFWLMAATVALVCWVNSPQQKRFAVLYVLLMTAAFYTHYFAALCVVVHWLFWCQTRGLSIRTWVLANSAIVALYLPWVPNLSHQLLQGEGLEWIPRLTWQSVLTAGWQFTVISDSVPALSWWRVVATLLILACAVLVMVEEQPKRHYRVLLVSYFWVPVLCVLLLSLFKPLFFARYLVFAAIALPLIVALALDAWGRRSRTLVFAVVALLVFGESQGLRAVYAQTDEMGGTDVRQQGRLDILAAGIAQESRSDDVIVIDGLFWYLPFMYYNTSGIQPRIYVYKSPTGEAWGPSRFGGWALVSQRAVDRSFNDFSALELTAKRVWWITGFTRAEHSGLFPKGWKQKLSLKEGYVEARLFTLNTAPTSPGADAQPFLTQQPPHSAQNYPPAPSATSASRTRRSLPQ